MKLKHLALLAIAGTLLCSCNSDIVDDLASEYVKNNDLITIKAHMGDNATRTSATLIENNKFRFAWMKGDAISVFSDSTLNKSYNSFFKLKDGDRNTSGEFEGSIKGDSTISCAIYPYDSRHVYNQNYVNEKTGSRINGSWYVYLPHEYGSFDQDYTENTNVPMIALVNKSEDDEGRNGQDYSNLDLKFKHLCAVMRLEIIDVPAEAAQVIFSTNSSIVDRTSKMISGYFKIEDIPNDTLELEIKSNNSVYYNYTSRYNSTSIKFKPNIDYANNGDSNSNLLYGKRNMTFFIPLPTGEYPDGFTIKITDKNGSDLCTMAQDGYMWVKDDTSFTLSRADVAMYPVLTLVYTPEGLIPMDKTTNNFNNLLNQGGTVKLDKDLNVGLLASYNDVTLDLNGHTLYLGGISIQSGTLTIIDSTNRNPFGYIKMIESNERTTDTQFFVYPDGHLKMEGIKVHSKNKYNIITCYGGTLDLSRCEIIRDSRSYELVYIEYGATANIVNTSIYTTQNASYNINGSESNEPAVLMGFNCTGNIEYTDKGPGISSKPKYELAKVWGGMNGILNIIGNGTCICEGLTASTQNTLVKNMIFRNPNSLGCMSDESLNNTIKLNRNMILSSPIKVNGNNNTLDFNGFTLSYNKSESNPSDNSTDQNKYTYLFYISGSPSKETSITFTDNSYLKGGGITTDAKNYNSINRAVWVDSYGSLFINGGDYFATQDNKNSKCEVIYIGDSQKSNRPGDVSILGGRFETDCYTGSIDTNEDIRYWLISLENPNIRTFYIDGGEFVNYNPCMPNLDYTENCIGNLYYTYGIRLKDANGKEITPDHANKTYHESNTLLMRDNVNTKIIYEVIDKGVGTNYLDYYPW